MLRSNEPASPLIGDKWPAGALLPELATITKAGSWAWKTLRAATDELQVVVDGVIDDLEGLGQSACAGGLLLADRARKQCDVASSVDRRAPAAGAARAIRRRVSPEGGEAGVEDTREPRANLLPLEDLLFGGMGDDVAADQTPVLLPDTPVDGGHGAEAPTLRRVPSHDFEIINFEDEVLWDDDDDDDF